MSYGNPIGNQGYPDSTNYDDEGSPGGGGGFGGPSGWFLTALIIIVVLVICVMIFEIVCPRFLPPDSYFVEHEANIIVLMMTILGVIAMIFWLWL